MFELSYRGGNSVVITTKSDELYIDPNQTSNGLKEPKLKNDVQLATEKRFLLDIDNDRPQLEGPGEYEVGPFTITGFDVNHHVDHDGSMKAACYRVAIQDVAIGVIGNIQPKLEEEELELLGLVDVVVIPVGGGGYTLDAKEAVSLIRKIEPKIVVPIHYREAGINYEVPQDNLDEFIKELEAPVEKASKLKLKSLNDIPPTLTVYQLERT